MHRRLIGVYVLAVSALVAGCSRPYDTPEVDQPWRVSDHNFSGFKEQLANYGRLRVLWTHGMCPHHEGWVEKRSSILRAAFGIGPEETSQKMIGEEKDRGENAQLYRRKFKTDQGLLDASFLVWSPLIEKYRRALEFDSPGANKEKRFPFERAELNNDLKVGLMNKCFIDAVVYSGSNGDPIRHAMRQAVCEALGGDFAGPDDCQLSGSAELLPLVFVTESLGSKLLFDAIRDIYIAESKKAAPDLGLLKRQLAATQMIYMVSNQVPLLDQANPTELPDASLDQVEEGSGETVSSIGTFMRILNVGPDVDIPKSLAPRFKDDFLDPPTIVAFTDPNDLLSYRLLPGLLKIEPSRLVNVIVSNADTLFGYLERPDTAHCGYAMNPHVIGMIVEGYDQNEPLPKADVLPSTGSCL